MIDNIGRFTDFAG